MKSEILNTIPKSGSFDEVKFDAAGDCLWVYFQDSKYLEWVGVFGYGWSGGKCVAHNSDGVSFVIAKGQGYILDINERNLLHKTECDYLKQCIANDNNEIFIATTNLEVYVYNKNGFLFSTERIASDGIEITSCKNNILTGKVYGFDEWFDFRLNLENEKYDCKWVYPIN